MNPSANRRDFLKAGAAVTAATLIPTAVHAAGDDAIKVGVIGCGGRGRGAVENVLDADKSVRIVALGDVFEDKAKAALNLFQTGGRFKKHAGRIDVGDRVFGGLDNYQKVLDAGIDLVILATPPGFRPQHLEAAVKAGKHIFTEKPVAVDAAGIRKCLALVDEAKKKNLAVVAGTQRRHQAGYVETVKRIQDGAIGDVVSARCSWNGDGIWFHPRKQGQSDVEYQLSNWYHFLWLCGDHIVEQHVHNLDVINWVLGAHPTRAYGFGGRSYRREGEPNEVGHIWDHFSVELEYPNGVHVLSTCTHIPNIKTDISEAVFGTKGQSQVNRYTIARKRVFSGEETNPYVQEHIDLIRSIRSGQPLNELRAVTESTMTAILARTAAYSGQIVTWEQGLAAREETMPEGLTLSTSLKTPPVPAPGKYKVIA